MVIYTGKRFKIMELAQLKDWGSDIQNVVLVKVLGVPAFLLVNLIDQLAH